ncbi:deoxyribodipyrimidine photo-lyase [Martelella alba]|uniref:Deoxyribodipyrimidine photo-lyase n=1 Tax=Martelella alba TaxID=2590451 RepID=A0ABY2SKU3_9HYPH|nr:deoxyribodipyrimidine photo-lyase [Martelella alba]TKI05445.1 deoxyribodipyrimidine photo-lyase [Martelella alba]
MKTHLVWLRNDLRIRDNPALHAACRDPSARVSALFIATPEQWRRHDMSPRQAAFLRDNLQAVQAALAERGIPLGYHQCADYDGAVDWLADYCRRERVDALFYNYQYEYNERQRDRAVERRLEGKVVCQGFDDGVLLPPGVITTGDKEMYKVFTPFRNAVIRRLNTDEPPCLPAPNSRGAPPAIAALEPYDYPRQAPGEDYPAGEKAALARLRHFCAHSLRDYRRGRDIPSADATSRLSAYLALGVLSPGQCYHRLRAVEPEVLTQTDGGAVWLGELIWRDFYRHLLVYFPRLSRHQPFITWTRHVAWRQDKRLFTAWCEGRTGFPIIDAAMRQLNDSGWMHNRLRMICASFLAKDLLIDWREGERYFMSRLIDGDLAANNGGWQWAASTGTDAAPYFRIFNPLSQGKKFDADGLFIRRWLPELAAVPDDYLHEPHCWPQAAENGLDYPLPIVDHKQARQTALAAYQTAKANAPGR